MDYSESFKDMLEQVEFEFNLHEPVKTVTSHLELSNDDEIKQHFEQIRDILVEYKTIQYRNVNN